MDFKAHHRFAMTQTRFTPDIAKLELSRFQLLFVCDDLMLAGRNYKIIGDNSAKLVRGFTQKHYRFYRKRACGTPVVMKPTSQPASRWDYDALKIKGELHAIESPAMTKVDNHYQNGLQYRRHRVKILYPYTPHGMLLNKDTQGRPLPPALQGPKHFLLPERVEPIECWMYLGIPSYWNDLLDGGFAFETVPIQFPKEDKNWLIKYYHFQNQP